MNIMNKILVKIIGLLLVTISIVLIVKLILIKDDYDLIVLASYVFLLTWITTVLISGIAFLAAKVSKKKTTEIVEDDKEDEEEEDEHTPSK